MCIETNTRDKRNTHTCAGLHWILGPQLADRADPEGERLEILTFFMHFGLVCNGIYPPGGAVFGSIDGNGKLAAVNIVRLHRSGYTSPGWWEKMWEMRILLEQMWSGSLPAVFANSKRKSLQQHIDTRVKKVFDETLYKLHARYAPGPHYYVAIMSTLPENQGQGHCSKLMRALNRAADLDGLPCYLECTR